MLIRRRITSRHDEAQKTYVITEDSIPTFSAFRPPV
ncbi:hypothetical protein Thiowin_03109 [Thiorhodovibrio winogradskyi]|uniref:Uncharacterized protein n=1 Tax=Thiorhodovibrio winogradskyi TaxID=77007 RepID=A0ABZ0SCK6_9GAMM